MENQNQNYVQYGSVAVEEENKQGESQAIQEKSNVIGDPSENIDGDELRPAAEETGIADVDSLLQEIDDKDSSGPGETRSPDPDDDDDDLEDDDDLDGDGLDEDSDDDDILPEEPDEDDLDLDEEEEDEDEFLNATQHS